MLDTLKYNIYSNESVNRIFQIFKVFENREIIVGGTKSSLLKE